VARPLEQSCFDARVQAVWAADGHVAKGSIKQRPVPVENQDGVFT
jgi:hypothetical protein